MPPPTPDEEEAPCPAPPSRRPPRRAADVDPARLLPEEVFADVLRRLAPRGLAASRCVCKAWRAAVDGHGLLLADHFPRSLDGIFLSFASSDPCGAAPGLFCRRSTAREVSGNFDYLDTASVRDQDIADHCNGLLLLYDHVVNPATRQWVRLPPEPPSGVDPPDPLTLCGEHMYLVFDPAVSPHYEVYLVPFGLWPGCDPRRSQEWPAPSFGTNVFSSRTGQWEQRLFVREGEAAGSTETIKSCGCIDDSRAAYWHGTLYVYLHNDFLMRMDLSNNRYQVIQFPQEMRGYSCRAHHLGKSEKGVYCALVYKLCAFQIWFIDESRGHMDLVLKHSINLEPLLANFPWGHGVGPWILHEDDNDDVEAPVEDKFEWDYGNDNVLVTEDLVEKHYSGHVRFLGFHPYREIVFFNGSNTRVMAFHLNSSKVQDLGEVRLSSGKEIYLSFPYTPCCMELPGHS